MKDPGEFIHLDKEIRSAIPTKEAAYHLGRQMQTLRSWACNGNGPLEPIHIGNRLLWRVSDIKKLLEMI